MKKSIPYILSNENIQSDGFWGKTFSKSIINKNLYLPLLLMLFSVVQAIGQLSIDVGQPINLKVTSAPAGSTYLFLLVNEADGKIKYSSGSTSTDNYTFNNVVSGSYTGQLLIYPTVGQVPTITIGSVFSTLAYTPSVSQRLEVKPACSTTTWSTTFTNLPSNTTTKYVLVEKNSQKIVSNGATASFTAQNSDLTYQIYAFSSSDANSFSGIENGKSLIDVTATCLDKTAGPTYKYCVSSCLLALDRSIWAPITTGASQLVAVTGVTGTWTATSNASSWLTVTNGSGTNNGSFTINASANSTAETRTGTITVSACGTTQTITVTQVGSATLNVSPTTWSPNYSAINQTFTVSSNTNWTVTNTTSWITITNGSGTGNGSFVVNLSPNPSTTARIATIVVNGQNITIVQDGSPACGDTPQNYCWSTAIPQNRFLYRSYIPTQVSGPKSSLDGGSPPFNGNAWFIQSGAGQPGSVVYPQGTNDMLLPINAVPFPYRIDMPNGVQGKTAKLYSNGVLIWSKVISDGEQVYPDFTAVTNQARVYFVIEDANSLTVSPSTWAPEGVASSQIVTVSSNINWTVSSNASWLTAAVSSGVNNSSFTINTTANTGATRTGVITVSGNGLTKTVTVNQEPPLNGVPCVVNKVRLLFRNCCVDRLVGAKIQGSNNNSTWTDLYTITSNATSSWQEFAFSNTTTYQYVRFVASANGYGELLELEFYNGSTKLTGTVIGDGQALDGNITTLWHGSAVGTGNYAGLQLSYACTIIPILSLSQNSWSPSDASNTLNVSVSSNVAWKATSSASWLTVSPGTGSNNGTLTLTTTANTGYSRSAIITVTGGGITQTITVNQAVSTITGPCIVNKVRLLFRNCCVDRLVGAKIRGSNNNSTWTDIYTFTSNATSSWQEFILNNSTAYQYVRFEASPNGYGELLELEFYNGSTKLTGTVIGDGQALDGDITTLWHGGAIGTGNYAGLQLTNACTITSPTLSLSQNSWSPSDAINTLNVGVSSNVAWTATSNASWLTVSPGTGSNNGTLILTTAANIGDTRNAVITVTAGGITQTITVNQAIYVNAAPCIVNKVRLLFRNCCVDRLVGAKIRGSNNNSTWTDIYTFTSNASTTWQEYPLSNTTPYQYVRFEASPNGYGELLELEFYNGSTKLTGTVIGDGQALDGDITTLWHGGAIGTGNYAGLQLSNVCTITASTISLSPNTWNTSSGASNQPITVTSNVPNWNVSSNVAWLTTTASSGSNNGSFNINATANTGGARQGIITVSANGVVSQTVTVNQTAPPMTVTPNSWSPSYNTANQAFTVTTTATWNVTNPASWITINTPSGSGNGSFTATVTANTATTSRTANISVTNGGGISQIISITQDPTPTLTVSPNTWGPSSSANSQLITVTSNINWNVTSSASWLTATTSSGSNNGSFTINTTANTGVARSATITVSGNGVSSQTVTITQAAPPSPITVTPSTWSPSYNTASQIFTVTTTATWNVTNPASWITINTPSGSGNGSFTATVTANTATTSRTANITVTNADGVSQIIPITQNPTPTLTVSPPTWNTSSSANSQLITVTSNINWNVSSSASWLTATTSSGSNNGTFTINATANTGIARSATITVSGNGVSSQTVTINQAAPPSPITVTPSTWSPSYNTASQIFTVTTTATWNVTNPVSWITINTPSGSGNGSFTATVTANTATTSRTANISVTNADGVSQIIPITQAANPILGISPTTWSPSSSASSQLITVTSNTSWNVASSATWLTATTSSGSNNGTFTINATANTGVARSATITVSGSGVASQTVTVNQAAPPSPITVTPSTWSPSYNTVSQIFTVTTTPTWTVTNPVSWITINTPSGSGNGSFTATVTANTATTIRTANITVTNADGVSQIIPITQAANPILGISPTTWSPSSSASSQLITVTSNTSWNVASNVAWLTATATSGNNDGSFTINTTANTGEERQGIITVSGNGVTSRTVTITQAAQPILSVNLNSWSTGYTGGSQTVLVTSNINWDITSNQAWLTTTLTSGSNNGSFTMNAAANTEYSQRYGTITISGGGITRTITVTQAATPLLTVSPPTWNTGVLANSQLINVTSNLSWNVSSNNAWLTVNSSSGINDGSFTISTASNFNTYARTGTITVTGGGITRTITVNQDKTTTLTVSPESWNISQAAASQTISVTSNTTWTVTNPYEATWISFNKTTGNEDDNFIVTATANTGTPSRTVNFNVVNSSGLTRIITVTQAGNPTLIVSPPTWNTSSSTSSQLITVTSNISWNVSSSASWLTATASSGSNNGSFTINATANTGIARSATITVSGNGVPSQTVTVTQAAPPVLSVNLNSWSTGYTGGSQTVLVTSNINWNISSNQSWLTTTPTSGSNNGSFTMNATANPDYISRSGIITITGGGITLTISVTQGATPLLTVSPPTWNTGVLANSQLINVTSNLSWNVSSNDSWLTVNSSSGTNNGSFTISTASNFNTYARTGTITVTGGGITRTITVNQDKTTTLTVSPESWNISQAAASQTFSVTSNTTWTVTNPYEATWISFNKTTGNEDDNFIVTATANTGTPSRTVNFNVVNSSGLTRIITVTQAGNPTLTISQNIWEPTSVASSLQINVSSTIAWTLNTSNPSWLTLSSSGSSNNGSFWISVTENTGESSRSGTVTVSGGGITLTVSVTQGRGREVTLLPMPFSNSTTTTGTNQIKLTTKESSDKIQTLIYPNPAEENITIEYYLDTDQNVTISLYDIQGKLIKESIIKSSKGRNKETLDIRDENIGIYFLRLTTFTKQEEFKVFKTNK